jgi:hypothetical protein
MEKKKESKSKSDVADLLVNNAYKILNWRYIDATSQKVPGTIEEVDGLPEGYQYFDQDELSKIVELVKPMLKDAQTTKKVEAENSQEVLKLISSGKISVNDGIKLMSLLKTKLELEEQEKKAELQEQMLNIINEEEEECQQKK